MTKTPVMLIVLILLMAACGPLSESSDADPTPTADAAVGGGTDGIAEESDTDGTAEESDTDGDAESSTADGSSDATVGADTLNDPYVDSFGNGGYDVTAYDLALTWDPDRAHLDGVATISATADHELTRFNLELVGLDVSAVTVGGVVADFDHTDPELAITPYRPIESGTPFTVEVAYGGTPIESAAAGLVTIPSGWHTRDGYAYVAGEPLSASTFHPANDHPIDKASFTYRITAPSDLAVAAVGTLTGTADNDDGTTTWTFDQPFPQATYLTTILIGPFTELDGGASDSGIPVRNVVDDRLVAGLGGVLDQQPAMIDAFEELFGPYPFDVYGAAVVADSFGGALETQTLSIFGADVLGLGDFAQSIVAHELAHQWFGNSVTLTRWEDIWLNEGFATYSEALWQEASDPDFSFERWITDLQAYGPLLEARVHDPGRRDLFGAQVYLRGAMALHALRVEVGDEVFFDLLKTWVARYGGANATTADFEALAEELSGQDLDELFDAWLRAEELPAELDGVELSG